MTAVLLCRRSDPRSVVDPWRALWAMMVGFFMILLDSTIVAVANPQLLEQLDTDYDGVLWVTSAYLLAYAVPLLLAGRLGDRFGPKNLYLGGLGAFTAASLWCGLAGSAEWLIAARAVQGVGAALMAPQTLSVITRIFPSDRRGVALGVWGATAGVATLVGPLAGGFLVDIGWQWIFIVNVPIGVVGLGLAFRFVPTLPTERARFDVVGVVLSGVGLFLVVFGLQEGESHAWVWWIWVTIASGLAFVAGFIRWQAVTSGEPLIPLKLFRDNDFSMSSVGVSAIACAATAQVVPLMFYAQAVCGLSPTWSAVLMAPTAVASGLLAPFVGRLVDRAAACPLVGFGFSAIAISLTWLSIELTPETPIWRLVVPLTTLGVGMAFVWAPLAAVATRNLPARLTGAGSGVYNTTRQVGSVLGSAGIAAALTSYLGAELPGVTLGGETTEGTAAELPTFLKEPFSAALSQALLLPASVALVGVVAAIFLGVRPASERRAPGTEEAHELDVFTAALRRREDVPDDHYFRDDDEYAEYTIDWPEELESAPVLESAYDEVPADEGVTEPLFAHVEHPLPAPADTWHGGPVESWHSLLVDEPAAPPEPAVAVAAPSALDGAYLGFDAPTAQPMAELAPPVEPTGFARNGFDVGGRRESLHPLVHPAVQPSVRPLVQPSGGRHARRDDEDAGTYGRHSMRFRD